MDQKIVFAADRMPPWPLIAQELADRGCAIQMRMIDGELALPDDTPSAGWRELRVGTRPGMITLRRDPDGIAVVTWGNADEALREAWQTIAGALAHLTGGDIK